MKLSLRYSLLVTRLNNRRRRNQKNFITGNTLPKRSRKSAMAGPTLTFSSDQIPFNFSADSTIPKIPLSPNQLQHCVQALNSFKDKRLNSPQIIQQEFQILQANRSRASEMRDRCSVALDGVNRSKNRYTDVIPFDSNRIVLKQCKDYRPQAKGYINASLVATSENVSQFIATQGPLPHTAEDFWEMIIQCRCPVIVMLTRLVDGNHTVKCGDYFQAEDGPREFGNICIMTKWIQTTNTSLVLRCIEVKDKESDELPLSVLHILYPEWPDFGVPVDTHAVREMFRRASIVPPNLGPIVVHCSAGIGRTGTYCAIHNTIQRVLVGDMTALDLVGTVTRFRSQRVGMVQTLEQYFFCYDTVIDELETLIRDSNSQGNL